MTYTSFFSREYDCVEDYIREQIEGRTPWINFIGLDDFNLLREKGLVFPKLVVRTSSGIIDEHYVVTDNFGLEGVEGGSYSGIKGIHKLEEILEGNRIRDGWAVYGEMGEFVFNFQEKNCESED